MEKWNYIRFQQICKELPKYGMYEDGRFYSSFHVLNKEDRNRVKWDNEYIK